MPVGDDPHGVLTDRAGKFLYVLNTGSDDICVIDLATLTEEKRLAASRSPWALAASPDGSKIYATNMLSRFVEPRTAARSEVTVLDTNRAIVEDRVVLPATNLLQGVAWHPSGEFALVTMLRTKNLIPMTRVAQGWTVTNGLGIVWADGRTDQVLLDEPGICFPDPDRTGNHARRSTGARRPAQRSTPSPWLILAKLRQMLETASAHEREHVIPNHLGKATEYVIARIATKNSPRGILVTPDGTTAWVANALDDSLTVIDLERLEAVERVDLGGPARDHRCAAGRTTFPQRGHHLPSSVLLSLLPPRRARRRVDLRHRTGWHRRRSGRQPNAARNPGHGTRSSGAERTRVSRANAVLACPHSLRACSRLRRNSWPTWTCTSVRFPGLRIGTGRLGAPLTDAQRRGKEIFGRTRTNSGQVIPVQNRCTNCHFPPLYTDRQRHDVGTKMAFDVSSEFDVPHLNNIYDSAPYLHNGTAAERWRKSGPPSTPGMSTASQMI